MFQSSWQIRTREPDTFLDSTSSTIPGRITSVSVYQNKDLLLDCSVVGVGFGTRGIAAQVLGCVNPQDL